MRLVVGIFRSALTAAAASAFLLNGEEAFRRLDGDNTCWLVAAPAPLPPWPAPPLLWRGAAPMQALCRTVGAQTEERDRARDEKEKQKSEVVAQRKKTIDSASAVGRHNAKNRNNTDRRRRQPKMLHRPCVRSARLAPARSSLPSARRIAMGSCCPPSHPKAGAGAAAASNEATTVRLERETSISVP